MIHAFKEDYSKWRALKRMKRKLQNPKFYSKIERLEEIICTITKKNAFNKMKCNVQRKSKQIKLTQDEKHMLLEHLERAFEFYGLYIPYSIERWAIE